MHKKPFFSTNKKKPEGNQLKLLQNSMSILSCFTKKNRSFSWVTAISVGLLYSSIFSGLAFLLCSYRIENVALVTLILLIIMVSFIDSFISEYWVISYGWGGIFSIALAGLFGFVYLGIFEVFEWT